MRAWSCDRCGDVAEAEQPPRGWERYSPTKPESPWWCGECVGILLAELQEQMRLRFRGRVARVAVRQDRARAVADVTGR